jgi:hypothetical protein
MCRINQNADLLGNFFFRIFFYFIILNFIIFFFFLILIQLILRHFGYNDELMLKKELF